VRVPPTRTHHQFTTSPSPSRHRLTGHGGRRRRLPCGSWRIERPLELRRLLFQPSLDRPCFPPGQIQVAQMPTPVKSVLPVVLLGCGGVGRYLLRHIVSCRPLHANQVSLFSLPVSAGTYGRFGDH
jgi:hypothetical protein